MEFEAFRPELNAALTYSDGTQGGRPPFDPVMMFKILVIQTTNNLSDERAEFLINDRLSFMRFLGFGLSDRVPDARTIWLFREKRVAARFGLIAAAGEPPGEPAAYMWLVIGRRGGKSFAMALSAVFLG